MRVRRYTDADWPECLRLCRALFPDDTIEAEQEEMRRTLARSDAAVFVLERPNGLLAGYVEAGTRQYAEGCATSPVGYIEAWYVDPDARRSGHGRRLLEAAEAWARDMGYSEMGSDALIDNVVSHEAHRRSGYAEVERVVMFRKSIG